MVQPTTRQAHLRLNALALYGDELNVRKPEEQAGQVIPD